VRQRSACNLLVVLGSTAPLHQLRSFASWLAGHGHLVRSITTNKEPATQPETQPFEISRAVDNAFDVVEAQQLLEEGLLAAAGPAAPGLSADGARAAASQQQQQQQRLNLASFSSDYASLEMLRCLPTHSLTHLRVEFNYALPEQYAEVPDVLARFSNLQQLQLDGQGGKMPGSCLAGIAQLSKLTQLQIEIGSLRSSLWDPLILQQPLQQLLSQPLPLRMLQLDMQDMLYEPLDLTALTQLEELITDGLHPQSKLPGQLRSVKLTGVRDKGLEPLRELQQLQRLDVCISVDSEATTTVAQLAQRLTGLEHLALRYTYAWDAVTASDTWCKLPQLRELSFDFEAGVRVRCWQIDGILLGVAAATSLTKLELEAFCAVEVNGEETEDDESPAEWECAPVAVCRQLSKLTGLQDLGFTRYTMLEPGDALQLTALTNLTRLVLSNMHDGVGDAAAAAIASNLTQLRHLDLSWCELGRDGGDLAEVEKLVHLTELRLEGNSQLSRDALNSVLCLPTDRSVMVGLDKQQRNLVAVSAMRERNGSDVYWAWQDSHGMASQ
jgi:hypothetical protein